MASEDYTLALKIVRDWESRQPVEVPKRSPSAIQPIIGAFLIGLLLGIGLMLVL